MGKYVTRGQRGYLAGIFDGEGSVNASLKLRPKHTWGFSVQVAGIDNTHIRGLHHVKSLMEKIVGYELHLTPENKSKPQNKPAFSVKVFAYEKIILFLTVLLPDLVIKRDQAILTMAHLKWRLQQPHIYGKTRRCYDDEVYRRDLAFITRLRALNGSPRTRTDHAETFRLHTQSEEDMVESLK